MATKADRVKALLKVQLGCKDEDLTPEAKIAEDLRADSLDQVEIIMGLEEEFAITIEDEDAEKLLTVGDVIKYVEANAPDQGLILPSKKEVGEIIRKKPGDVSLPEIEVLQETGRAFVEGRIAER